MLNDWRFYALSSATFAALTAIFGKIGVSEVNSNLATLIRTVVIFLVTAAIVLIRREWTDPLLIPRRTYFFLVLSGIATGISWLAYYRALQLAPASKVAPLDKLSVAIVVIFAAVFLGEAMTWKVGLGTLLITAGVIILGL